MAKVIKNILIPVNFSESSDCAMNTAIAMCKRHQAALHILHINKKSLIPHAGKNAIVADLTLKTEILDRLEIQANKIQSENHIDCYYHSLSGEFHNAVAEIAQDFYCDLIILEKAQHTGILDLFKQNSAYLIHKHVNCPVLTMPAEKRYLDFKKIMSPVKPISAGLEKLAIAIPLIQNKSRVLFFAPAKDKKMSDVEAIHHFINSADHLMTQDNAELEKELKINPHETCFTNRNKSDFTIFMDSIVEALHYLFEDNDAERILNNPSVPVLSVKLN